MTYNIRLHNHLDTLDLIGRRVSVYYNLHKDTFSIKYKSKVVHWADSVNLVNVRFYVSEKAMIRINQDARHKKEVHAYVIGDLVSMRSYTHKTLEQCKQETRPQPFTYKQLIKYNPLDMLPYFRNAETNERIDFVPMLTMQNFYHDKLNRMKPTIYEP
jgi:hypothetical protein